MNWIEQKISETYWSNCSCKKNNNCFQTCLNGFSLIAYHIEWGDLRNINCFYGKGQLKFMHVLWVIVYRPQLIHQEVCVSLSFIMRGSNKSMHIYRTYVAGAGLRSINELREWGFITVEMSSTLLCKCWRNKRWACTSWRRSLKEIDSRRLRRAPQTQPYDWPIHFRNHKLFSIKPCQRSNMWHSLCQAISIGFLVDIRPWR